MSTAQLVKSLKNVLDQHEDQYEIDVDKIHGILDKVDSKNYLDIANVAFNKFLNSQDSQYKSLFGIAITYARDRGVN